MADDRPLMVGLTGSIGMGKTETAKMFARLGIPVYDADAEVARLYEVGGAAVPVLAKAFPGVIKDGRVDRETLSKQIVGNEAETKRLESMVYPLMGAARQRFLDEARANKAEIVVFDVPRLFETGGHRNMDAVVVTSAPGHIQRERVLKRPGMTAEKFEYLHARQTPDEEKRAQAHFVVVTDKGLDHAFEQVKMIVSELKRRKPELMAGHEDA
jgi:dephospho-CoA kinase